MSNVIVQQRADLQRWIGAQGRDPLTGLMRMYQGFVGLCPQPRDDRNAAEAEHEKRIVRVSHDAGEFGFQNPVQHGNHLILLKLCHLCLRVACEVLCGQRID